MIKVFSLKDFRELMISSVEQKQSRITPENESIEAH